MSKKRKWMNRKKEHKISTKPTHTTPEKLVRKFGIMACAFCGTPISIDLDRYCPTCGDSCDVIKKV